MTQANTHFDATLPVELRITGRVPDSTVSPMLLDWSATRMGGMLTKVAHWLAVMNGGPSVAICACE